MSRKNTAFLIILFVLFLTGCNSTTNTENLPFNPNTDAETSPTITPAPTFTLTPTPTSTPIPTPTNTPTPTPTNTPKPTNTPTPTPDPNHLVVTLGNDVIGTFDRIKDDYVVYTISGTGATHNFNMKTTTQGNPRKYPEYQETVKEIIIEEGVTRIGDNVCRFFYNCEKIVFPSTLEEIGSFAFADCGSKLPYAYVKGELLASGELVSNLEETSVKTIEDFAFSNCSLGHIVLPESLETIGMGAFEFTTTGLSKNVEKVDTLTIPSKVKYVDDLAFYKTDYTKFIINGKSSLTEFEYFSTNPKMWEENINKYSFTFNP